MTNANMKLVIVSVDFEDELVQPKPKLGDGEFIVTRVIELNKLYGTLAGERIPHPFFPPSSSLFYPEYDKKVRHTIALAQYFTSGLLFLGFRGRCQAIAFRCGI
jgi:hypothetical protein